MNRSLPSADFFLGLVVDVSARKDYRPRWNELLKVVIVNGDANGGYARRNSDATNKEPAFTCDKYPFSRSCA